jgi:NADH:ubiquinone oxidoreductase subunit 5 (subunit L)/multisubunit Na+/H+ antiporter MnhA subunit
VENDVKKVIAFSTLSQLGLMVFSLGLGLPSLCFFHLVSHALFKAKMFICAGYSLLRRKHNQDVRILELYHTRPVIEVRIFLSLVNLKGLWFLSGFFSKDFLLEKDSIVFGVSQMFLLLVSLLFTRAYSFRLFFLLSQTRASSPFGFGGQGTQVPVYLRCASVLFGFVVKRTFLRVGKVGVLWKGILLLLVFRGGFLGYFFCFSFSSRFLKGIGSLNYFNSDYFLKRVRSIGLALFNTLDKGIFPLLFFLPKTTSSFRLLFSSVFSGVFLLGFALLFI